MKNVFLILISVLFTLGWQRANAQTGQGVVINGVVWATKNVGATAAEQNGNYYTWQRAHTACPDGWRLPTKAELESLAEAGGVWTTQNGKKGRKFSEGGKSIFLPAVGYKYIDGKIYNIGDDGAYWGGYGEKW